LIGFFVNTHVLRADVAPTASFAALLADVKHTALAAQAHADLPFEQLVDAHKPQRSLSHSPLFQVMFNFLGAGPDQPCAFGDLAVTAIDLPHTTTQLALNLAMG